MRIARRPPVGAAILSIVLLPFLAAASIGLDCKELIRDDIHFDLSALGGPRSVIRNVDHGGVSSTNTTYTIDVCRHLGKVKKVEKQCPNGTRGMHIYLRRPSYLNSG